MEGSSSTPKNEIIRERTKISAHRRLLKSESLGDGHHPDSGYNKRVKINAFRRLQQPGALTDMNSHGSICIGEFSEDEISLDDVTLFGSWSGSSVSNFPSEEEDVCFSECGETYIGVAYTDSESDADNSYNSSDKHDHRCDDLDSVQYLTMDEEEILAYQFKTKCTI
ncbi:hypothetical protein GWI33_007190 [Rhynchophorus ferrugineus]|uniref:Uncharacterized protein n=1 Tax=Rhynchophorus ferrugineus TaxID=354439 RepID=A0A834IKN8_RHYFE|nr:hypothetical protein GWI33_007190 [Rhynchophorus ferrugineus]